MKQESVEKLDECLVKTHLAGRLGINLTLEGRMAEPKLQQTASDSFYGDYLYENIVPKSHFLRQLREIVPWQRFTYRLIKYYRGRGQVGRPPIDPAIMLKMLLLRDRKSVV